jgi:hypothetical protein
MSASSHTTAYELPLDPVSLAYQYRVAHILADVRLVLRLDNLWTSSLATHALHIHDLQTLARKMINLLRSISRNIQELQEPVTKSPHLQTSWQRTLSQMPLDEEHKQDVEKRISDKGGFEVVAKKMLEDVSRILPSECEHLSRELRQLASGQHSSGDLSQAGRCALLGAGVVLSAATAQLEIAGWLAVIGAAECF